MCAPGRPHRCRASACRTSSTRPSASQRTAAAARVTCPMAQTLTGPRRSAKAPPGVRADRRCLPGGRERHPRLGGCFLRRSRARAARVWDLGPIPIRAYALCIIAGIIAAIWIGERRWVARGGQRGTVSDIAVWAVIFGLVGGRLYHVITDNELYFRAGRDPWRAFYVWEGGLGIWGAIALGGVGAWIGCRPARDQAAAVRGRVRARDRGGAGDRPLGQLLQPGAVRAADRPALGGADRPGPAEHGAGRDRLPPHLPVRVALGPGPGRRAGLRRPAVQDGPRPGLRPVRDGLHGRAGVDRAAAHRHRQPRARAAAERVDLDHRLRRRAGVLPAPPGAAGDRRRARC